MNRHASSSDCPPPPASPLRSRTPLHLCPVAAGWPSPAEDYIEETLNLHQFVVRNQAATYFVRATGDSMIGAGIHAGDLLVVDRSLEPLPGKVVIAAVDGELTVKRLLKRSGRVILSPENDTYEAIDVTDNEYVRIWGVVTYVLHSL